MSKEQENGRKPLPDPTVCHTLELKPVNLMECLVQSPELCAYVIEFGGGKFCRHPDCHRFQKPPVA
jgi:hypothetical protein